MRRISELTRRHRELPAAAHAPAGTTVPAVNADAWYSESTNRTA